MILPFFQKLEFLGSYIGKETGLGWDANKQTIDATDEWWEEKIKVSSNIIF